MDVVYFSIIPLRRVPPNLSLLTYAIAKDSRLPEIGEILKIPFGLKSIFGLVWSQVKLDTLSQLKIKCVSTPKKCELKATKIQLKTLEWLNSETLTPYNDIALRMVFSNQPDDVNQINNVLSPISIITAPTFESHKRCIQEWSQKLKQDPGNTLILLPTINDVVLWKKSLPSKHVFIHAAVSKTKILKTICKKSSSQIFIGTYSALFFPLPKINRIIVDYADDEAYFTFDQRPRIDIKKLVIQYSKFQGAKLIFLCRWLNPELTRISKNAELTEIASFPPITLIDRNNEPYESPRPSISQITFTHVSQGRNLWFVRARGEAQLLRCKDCGANVKCEKCGTNLRLISKNPETLECPIDLTRSIAPSVCKVCKGISFHYLLPGIKSVTTEIKKYFPEAKICTYEKGKHVGDLENSNHIISTSAIRTTNTKLFNNIIVLQGDSFASQAFDYRSQEKELELLATLRQLLLPKGKLYIQTFQPDHNFFKLAEKPSFASTEILLERDKYFYPPSGLLISLTYQNKSVINNPPLSADIQKEITDKGGIITTNPVFTLRISLKLKNWVLDILNRNLAKGWEAIIDPPTLNIR
jgi:primosomal protein N'